MTSSWTSWWNRISPSLRLVESWGATDLSVCKSAPVFDLHLSYSWTTIFPCVAAPSYEGGAAVPAPLQRWPPAFRRWGVSLLDQISDSPHGQGQPFTGNTHIKQSICNFLNSMIAQKCSVVHQCLDVYVSFSLYWTSLSVQELYSLMFSLDWVSIKARIMGPAHLISDYMEYGHILDKEVSIQAKLV